MTIAEKISSIGEWMNLTELSVPSLASEMESGSVFVVNKVGFLAVSEAECRKIGINAKAEAGSKCVLPTAVVELNGRHTVLRLPLDLAPWVLDCVAIAHTGRNQFPSKVEFGELAGRMYAEFVE